MTHRSRVDEDDDDEDQQYADEGANDPPLVVFPDDELEGLPRRREPQERRGRTAERREGRSLLGKYTQPHCEKVYTCTKVNHHPRGTISKGVRRARRV